MDHPSIDLVSELADLLKPFNPSLSVLKQDKIKLIIHAGTPKTGTTSIQTYLDKKQRKLRGKGILFPHSADTIKNTNAPKHQWLEKNLLSCHKHNLLINFKNILSQVKDGTHTIILSSEGIYNYWWDFSAESKALLKDLGQLFDIELWVWFREPLAFIESFYKQCIRNPQVDGNPCYGKDLSFADMLDIPWFAQQLNYQGFVSECQALFGQNKVAVFAYQGDTVQQVSQKLGLATAHDNPTVRQNQSLHNCTISLLRTINQQDLKAKDKELMMPHLKQINALFGHYPSQPLIDHASRNKVLALYKPVSFEHSSEAMPEE